MAGAAGEGVLMGWEPPGATIARRGIAEAGFARTSRQNVAGDSEGATTSGGAAGRRGAGENFIPWEQIAPLVRELGEEIFRRLGLSEIRHVLRLSSDGETVRDRLRNGLTIRERGSGSAFDDRVTL